MRISNKISGEFFKESFDVSIISIEGSRSVRVQPFPSYFGYIMHNNILMMLDLVAVTEYYLLEKSANRKI